MPEVVEDQLIQLVRATLENRRKNNIVRNDFLESVAALFNTSKHFEDELEIVAHAASFFADGYETSSRVKYVDPQKIDPENKMFFCTAESGFGFFLSWFVFGDKDPISNKKNSK